MNSYPKFYKIKGVKGIYNNYKRLTGTVLGTKMLQQLNKLPEHQIILNELKMPHKRLIQISSVGCYGATTRFKGLSHIVTEHEIEKPVGLYEETKTKADDYIRK